MKKYILLRSFLLLGLVGSLLSCETDASVDLNYAVQEQLVVSSFISPQDTALIVRLQRTQPALGKQYSPDQLKVTNATVKISDGSQTIQLQYNLQRDVYRAKKSLLPIVAGKTYALDVTTPNGWKATATATVPVTTNIAITTYQISAEDYNPGGNFAMLRNFLSFKWQDAPGRDNYYRTLAYREATNPSNPTLPPYQQTFNALDDVNSFVSDSRRDGEELTSSEQIYYSQKPDEFPHPYRLNLILLVTDRDYYLYNRSVFQQRENDGNPFAEPTLLYRNITGGLGIFSAYTIIKEVRQVN